MADPILQILLKQAPPRKAGPSQKHIEALCTGVNDLLDNLASIVTSVTGSAAAISTSASEIAAGYTDLSQRTEEQAASLEQTAATL